MPGPPRRAHRARGVRDAAGARRLGAHRRARRERGQGRRPRRRRSRSTARKLDVEVAGGGRTASVGAALRAWQAGVDLVPLERRRLGPRADDVVRQARRSRRRSARVARRRSQGADVRAARSRAARARSSTSRRRPSSIGCARCSTASPGSRRSRRRRASSASCARTSSAASTGWRSAATPASAACSPTTWVSARRSRRSPRSARRQDARRVARPACCSTGSRRPRKFRPDLDGRDLPRRAPRARSPSADVVLTSYPILRNDIDVLGERRVGHRDPRRVADDQEPRQPGRARRLQAQGAVARDAVRHADREPARRAVEPAPLHQPRPARRAHRLRRIAGPSRSGTAIAARPRACASGSGRSCCAA